MTWNIPLRMRRWCEADPQPAWDTRESEEFSESDPKFLNYDQ